MKRLQFTIVPAVVTALAFLGLGQAAGPFNQRLSPDQQIIHALNRLTFGPQPGDVEQVRRIGLSKWIELQLHPDQIPENPTLDTKLKPLATLPMPLNQVVEQYTPRQQDVGMALLAGNFSLNTLLSNDQVRKVMNGTAEDRTEVLKSLDPDKRKQVLTIVPPTVLEYTPVYKEEAAEAQKVRQEQLRMEVRRRNPQLNDMLSQEDVRIARTGNKEQFTAL